MRLSQVIVAIVAALAWPASLVTVALVYRNDMRKRGWRV
jgi:hypothetical protein